MILEVICVIQRQSFLCSANYTQSYLTACMVTYIGTYLSSVVALVTDYWPD